MIPTKRLLASALAAAIAVSSFTVPFPVFAEDTTKESVSTFYYNGDIITVDEEKGETKSGKPVYASAVLTQDGKILDVAYSKRQANKLKEKAEELHSKTVDLDGKTMIPAFIDPHSHIDMVDKYYDASPSSGVVSIETMIEKGKEQLADWKKTNADKIDDRVSSDQYWFMTNGFDNTAFAEDGYRMPTKEDLDQISTEYPIVYIHASSHMICTNTLALQLLNNKLYTVFSNDKDPEADKEEILKSMNTYRSYWDQTEDSNSLNEYQNIDGFTGMMREAGFYVVYMDNIGYNVAGNSKYLATLGDTTDYFTNAIKTYAKNGITTAVSASGSDYSGVFASLDDSDLLIDVVDNTSYKAVQSLETSETSTIAAGPSADSSYNEDNVKFGGVKIFLDGSPQGKTARFAEDLTDTLSHGGYYKDVNEVVLDGTTGREFWYGGTASEKLTDEEATEQFLYCIEHKYQFTAHANGTAAINQFIDCYEAALTQAGIDTTDADAVAKIADEIRPVIIHAQTITQKQIDRCQELGINISFFTDHVYYYGDYHLSSTLGPVRGNTISPMADALETDVNITMHQDSPVAPPNMIFSIFNAANRITRDGQAIGRGSADGDDDPRITTKIEENVAGDTKDERISAYEALKTVTLNGAWQHFEEETKGSIEAGKQADFVILNTDILSDEFLDLSTADAQKDTFIEMTINDDKVIYQKEQAKITSVSVAAKAVYTGKAITPSVTVTSGDTVLTSGKDYTVTYKNNKNCGKATVTVKGMGDYSGTMTKSFYIYPKKAVLSKVTGQKGSVKVIAKPNAGNITGYQICYSVNKNFKSSYYKTSAKASCTINNLKKHKTFYIKVRAYKTVGSKKLYGNWSTVKTAVTK